MWRRAMLGHWLWRGETKSCLPALRGPSVHKKSLNVSERDGTCRREANTLGTCRRHMLLGQAKATWEHWKKVRRMETDHVNAAGRTGYMERPPPSSWTGDFGGLPSFDGPGFFKGGFP
eukprot:s737_g5.t1